MPSMQQRRFAASMAPFYHPEMTSDEPVKPLPLLPVEGGAPHRWGFSLTCLLTCTIGLLIGMWIVNSGVDLQPEARLVRGTSSYIKTLAFRETKDAYDVVFLGSSRVQRGIHPADFDARMDELGRPVRSFNFGIGGIRFPETVYWADWILAQRPERLRWFFIELQPVEHWIQPKVGWRSKRFLNWHTWKSTALSLGVLEVEELEDADWRKRQHLNGFLRRSFNIGNGIYALGEVLSPGSHILPPAGYDWSDSNARNLKLGLGWRNYQSGPPSLPLGPLVERGGQTGDTSPLLCAAVDAIVTMVEAHGIEPILFRGPAGRPRLDLRQAFRAGDLPTLFAYELSMGWKLAKRYNAKHPGSKTEPKDYFSDSLHLNEAGAHVFGRLMADDFHAYLETQGADTK